MFPVTQVITSQTLSSKKGVTNELRTLSYELWITPLFSTRYDFRGLIDSLNCREKINGVGWKWLFLHMTRYDIRIKPYSVIWHHFITKPWTLCKRLVRSKIEPMNKKNTIKRDIKKTESKTMNKTTTVKKQTISLA